MNTTFKKKLMLIALFGAAMAALEAAVVVYLRALYYPNGFTVAMQFADAAIIKVEVVRELATIIMLLCIGLLTGKTRREKLAWFLLTFAAWDLGYYFWLKLFLDWPSSILDWDILFLIPIAWVAPVLAPVICSVTMIMLALVLLKYPADYAKWISTALIGMGCLLMLTTFMADYVILLSEHHLWSSFFDLLGNPVFTEAAGQFEPSPYRWATFILGECCLLGGIFSIAFSARPLHDRDIVNVKLLS